MRLELKALENEMLETGREKSEMKKILIMFVLYSMLGLTACNTKAREETLAQTTEAVSELGELAFMFNGYWNLESQEQKESLNLSESQLCDLSATHIETGTNISIFY